MIEMGQTVRLIPQTNGKDIFPFLFGNFNLFLQFRFLHIGEPKEIHVLRIEPIQVLGQKFPAFIMQFKLHKVIIRVLPMLGHRNNLLIAIGRNSYLPGVFPSHFHIIIDDFSRHFHVLQCLMGSINHRNPEIIRVQLHMHRFHSFFCKIIRSIGSQIPVVYLPAHIGPAGINLPNHHT